MAAGGLRRVVVRGFWGPRVETVERCARRWEAFLARARNLDPAVFTGWRTAEEPPAPVEATAEAMTAHMLARVEGDEVDRGASYSVYVWSESEGRPQVSISGWVGGRSSAVHNRVVVTAHALRRSALGLGWPRMAVDLLTALAETWEPDWGDVGESTLWDRLEEVQERATNTPTAGFATYVSPGRAAQVPTEIPGRRVPTADGGLIVDLVEVDGTVPDWQVVAELDQALRTLGAFAPMPTDRGRVDDPS